MPADSTAIIALMGKGEMEACREALIGAGMDEDAPLVADLEMCAYRALRGEFHKPFEINPLEAPLVLDALTQTLRATPYEQQANSTTRHILRRVHYTVTEHAVAEAA